MKTLSRQLTVGSKPRDPGMPKPAAPSVRGAQADVIALEHAAGNRAVCRLMGSLGVGSDSRASESVRSAVAAGSSRPLDSETRSYFESRFHANLGRVRIHTDSLAAESADTLDAQAFTLGQDILFATGAYAPHTTEGFALLAHELAHVIHCQGRARSEGPAHEVSRERPLIVAGLPIYRKRRKGAPAPPQPQDVAIIVARPSMSLEKYETPEDKRNMGAWRAAARGLAPVWFEGLDVDSAFGQLRKVRRPIRTLYIIGHADESGILEINPKGEAVSTTIESVAERMKKATRALGSRRPETVQMLNCFGGTAPQTIGAMGRALGARRARAPVGMTVITYDWIEVGGRRLTRPMRGFSDRRLNEIVRTQTQALTYYDYVPGVSREATSDEDKLRELVRVLRRTGGIPYISFNAAPGKRDAVPYWRAPVEKRAAAEELSAEETLQTKGQIEVEIAAPE